VHDRTLANMKMYDRRGGEGAVPVPRQRVPQLSRAPKPHCRASDRHAVREQHPAESSVVLGKRDEVGEQKNSAPRGSERAQGLAYPNDRKQSAAAALRFKMEPSR
jgi:hypothetical protein